MSLKQLIIDAGSNKTAAELVAELNAATVEVRDDQLYTWAGVALVIGAANAEGLRLALDSSGVGWVVHQLGGSGLQLSHALTQGLLAQFAAAPTPVAGAAELALIGIHFVSPFVNDGGEGLVALEEVEAALDEISLDAAKSNLLTAGAAAWNAFNTAVDAWDGSGDAPVLGGA